MSTSTIALINQIMHSIATNNETSHRIIQWIDSQAKYNTENNKDIRDLDIGLERIETKVEKVQEDLERKRKDVEGIKEKQAAADRHYCQASGSCCSIRGTGQSAKGAD